jgi:hypothetical protein
MSDDEPRLFEPLPELPEWLTRRSPAPAGFCGICGGGLRPGRVHVERIRDDEHQAIETTVPDATLREIRRLYDRSRAGLPAGRPRPAPSDEEQELIEEARRREERMKLR